MSSFADPDIQSEIDTYISRDHATFSVLLLVGFVYLAVVPIYNNIGVYFVDHHTLEEWKVRTFSS